jgi:hypothetical protein
MVRGYRLSRDGGRLVHAVSKEKAHNGGKIDYEDLVWIMLAALAFFLMLLPIGIIRERNRARTKNKAAAEPGFAGKAARNQARTSRINSIVLRALAGIISLAFGAVLIFADNSKMSNRELWGFGFIAVVFAAYSLLGNEWGEWILQGCPATKPKTNGQDLTNGQHSDTDH